MDKIITFPAKTLDVLDERTGEKTGKAVNAFIHFLGLVVELAPQKNDTATFLAHEIREKLDALKPTAKTITLSDSAITFIQEGVSHLRTQNRVAGSGWYYLLDPLRSAKAATK